MNRPLALVNAGRHWLVEDVINLLELVDEGRTWQDTAYALGRSVNACKIRYGQIRFAYKLRNEMDKVSSLIIVKPIKPKRSEQNA